MLLSGDLNSRTANIFPELYDNTNEPEFQHTSAPLNTFSRKSEDSIHNNYGKMLLNLCTAFNLCILNGMCKGDHDGCYTYISDNGSSVNDYFLISYDLFDEISDICKFVVHDRIDSDHLPVTLHLSLKYNDDYMHKKKINL